MRNIKNIIFDLGGVIINLDQELTIIEFNKLSALPFENIYNPRQQNELFDAFDKGIITEAAFFKNLANAMHYKGNVTALQNAWNTMLLGVPEHRLDVLVDAKRKYRTFLLSNTNETHVNAFEKDLYLTHGVKNFHDYFDKVYYSCRIGMRKPDKEIFEHVLAENRLQPQETVFIDDSIQHIKAAGSSGINAYLLEPHTEIGELLREIRLL